MDWKQIVYPRPARLAYKRAKRLRAAAARRGTDFLLARGRPRPLARHLRGREPRPAVVRRKHGVLYLSAGDWFLRYANSPSAVAKLEREFAGWRLLKERGLEAILQHSVRLHALEAGVLLESERLQPITREDQMAATVPILSALACAARPVVINHLPPTVEAGLDLAQRVTGGGLPPSFSGEAEIREGFAQPLRFGLSHQDIQLSNVMREAGGRPVLIDLKSYVDQRVLALDILNFACKYMTKHDRHNVVAQALAAQRRGWDVPELAPALAFVDLPRPLWGPVYALHCLGRVALKSDGGVRLNPLLRRSLARLLSQDWRFPHPAPR